MSEFYDFRRGLNYATVRSVDRGHLSPIIVEVIGYPILPKTNVRVLKGKRLEAYNQMLESDKTPFSEKFRGLSGKLD
jgi:hypothetical protein